MIDIKIGDYKVSSDERQFIISQRYVQQKDTKARKEGEIYYEDKYFFSKLESVINKLLMLKLRKKDIYTLESLRKELVTLKKDIEGYING